MNIKFLVLLMSMILFFTGCGVQDYESQLVKEDWDTSVIDLDTADYNEVNNQIKKLIKKRMFQVFL